MMTKKYFQETKKKSNKIREKKDSIPDCHSVLDLLHVVADDFVLDVVQHADT